MKTKFIAFVMGLLLVGSAMAVDSGGNSVYIDQTNADNSTVSITQSGSGNSFGDPNSLTNPQFTIDGNNMSLTVTQDGMNNSITGNFVGGGGVGVILQQGNSNSTVLNYGNMGTDNGNLNLSIVGSNNSNTLNIGTLRDASNYTYGVNLTGDSNSLTSTINSKYTNNSFTITGDSNTLTTTQTGFHGTNSAAGHSITSSVIGDNNAITVLQNGTTNANSAIINVTGSGAAVSVTQH